MKIHQAEVLQDSIENLGANGLAFTVRCCGDSRTDARHTVHLSHTMSDAELQQRFEHHAKEAARAHLAEEHNAERALQMLGQGGGCAVCGGKQ